MKLSPIYERKLAQSREEGIQQGIQQGIQRNIIRLLRKKVSDLPTNLESQIMSLSVTQLEDLGEALFDFNSVDDLINWLDEKGKE